MQQALRRPSAAPAVPQVHTSWSWGECVHASQVAGLLLWDLCSWLTPTASPHAATVVQAKWYQWGFLFSVLYLAVWVFVGGAWWKAIGIF